MEGFGEGARCGVFDGVLGAVGCDVVLVVM